MPDESKAPAEDARKKSSEPTTLANQGGHAARDEEDSGKGLASHELEQQALIARPPLGN